MKSSLLQELKRIKSQHESRKNRHMDNEKASKPPKPLKTSSIETQPQLPKQSSKPRSKSINKILFKDLIFCFPVKDIELSPRVIAALNKLITKHGGSVIEFEDNLKGIRVNYLLCSRKIDFIAVERKVDFKVLYEQIVDYQYVKHCVNSGKLIGIDQYLIFDGNCSAVQVSQTMVLEESTKEQLVGNMSIYDCVGKRRKVSEDFPNCGRQKTNDVTGSELRKGRKQPNKQRYLCHKGSSGAKHIKNEFPNNQIIIEKLQELHKIYTNDRDIGRKLAYMKAVSAIKGLSKDIRSVKDIKQVRGIGPKIRDKIQQILQTGILQKLSNLQCTEKNVSLVALTRIWGIGPTKAKQLYEQYSIKSIPDLRQNKETVPLTKNQLLGLKYYQQFKERMPWNRVTLMFQRVRDTLYRIVGSRDSHYIQCCGSYRRKKATCGDMDIIISRKDGAFQKGLLLDLISALESERFITDHLSLPRRTDHESMSYMGVCQFKQPQQPRFSHHRIDIKNYPMGLFAFAILYFTGSDAFNRSMRLFARRKGMSLSDKGLLSAEDKDRDGKGSICSKVRCQTERDIFQYLGLDYRTPEERCV